MKITLSLLAIALIFGCANEPSVEYGLTIFNDYDKSYNVTIVTEQPYYPMRVIGNGIKCGYLNTTRPISEKSSVEFRLKYNLKCTNNISISFEDVSNPNNYILIDSKTIDANGDNLLIRFP